MRSRVIHARFAGRCRTCGKAVAKGELVYFAKHYGVRCSGCGPHTAEDQPIASRRGKSRKAKPLAGPDVTDPKSRAARRCADGIHRYEVHSVGEAVEDALCDYAQNDGNRELIREDMKESLSGKSTWANHFTRQRLLAEVFHPDRRLLEAVDEMREQLIGALDLPTTPRRKVRRGQEDGEELDADRWLSREPGAWDRSVREPQARRTLTIGCNLSVNANAQPHQLLYRGAAALALADLLTQQGCNVAIVAMHSAEDPTQAVERTAIRYELKSPLMPLDLSAVAFAMCEIAFFRLVCVYGGARHLPGKLRESYGRARTVPQADREGIDYLIDADCLSRESAVEWLRSQVRGEVAHV